MTTLTIDDNRIKELFDPVKKKKSGLNLHNNQDYLIVWACENGYADTVKQLLGDSTVDPNINERSPIVLAFQNGHIEVIKLLLSDSRVDPGAEDNYIIQLASQYGYEEILKLLLDDPRVDPSNNYALQLALENKHIGVVKILLGDLRVDPNNDKIIKLIVENGYTEVLKSLLGNSRIEIDDSDLHLAAEKCHVEMIKLLEGYMINKKYNQMIEKEQKEKEYGAMKNIINSTSFIVSFTLKLKSTGLGNDQIKNAISGLSSVINEYNCDS